MKIRSLTCPNCNGPLHPQANRALTICVYCNSTLRLEPDADPRQVVEATTPSAEALQAIKQLLLNGRRAEALEQYQRLTGASATDAAGAVDDLAQQLRLNVFREQPVANLGFLIALAQISLPTALVWFVSQNIIATSLVALALLAFTAWYFAPGVRLRWLNDFGVTAPATVLKVSALGQLERRNARPLQLMRLWLEVRPPGQAAFQLEKNVVANPATADRLREGLVIEVACDPARQHAVPRAPLKVLNE